MARDLGVVVMGWWSEKKEKGNMALGISAYSFSLFFFSAGRKSHRRTRVWLVIKKGTASCVASHDFLSFPSCS